MPGQERVGLEQVLQTTLQRRLANPAGYSLCAEAEQNLVQAAHDFAVAAVQDTYGPIGIFKIKGRRIMLAVADRVDANGNVFERGSWYMPAEREAREKLVGEMDNGATHMFAAHTEWILLRRAGGVVEGKDTGYTEEEILTKANEAISQLPTEPQLTVRSGLSRRAYRELHREGFNAGYFAL